MKVTAELRKGVTERASRRCEYCGLPDRLQVGGFEVDHIIPLSRGGLTTLQNLAYVCPHCNDRKWTHTEAEDYQTGAIVLLFHPRRNAWNDHFEWSSANPFEILGKSQLQLNHPELVAIRRLLSKLGIQ